MTSTARQAPQRRPTWHDVVDLQGELAEWLVSEQGLRFLYEAYLTTIRTNGAMAEGTITMTEQLYGSVPVIAREADPIFVTTEMCELVEHAAKDFQPEPLIPRDLMTAYGFLVYEKPFQIRNRYDEPFELRGVGWTPVLSGDDPSVLTRLAAQKDEMLAWLNRHDYVSRWAEHEDDILKLAEQKTHGVDGLSITLYGVNNDRTIGPPMLPSHVTPWWFGMKLEGNEYDLAGRSTAVAEWWRIVQTTLRLMQQPRLVHPMLERPSRATRRMAGRRGLPEDRDVVVVRLRRPKRAAGDHGPEHEAYYSHRFWVNGHWRQQWYPSDRAHRQIWIEPFIKGDPELPLIWRPNRAYNWSL